MEFVINLPATEIGLAICEKYHKCFKCRQLLLEQNLWAAMRVLGGTWARKVGFIFTCSC